MNNVTSTHIYLVFVLVLLTIGWGVSKAAIEQVKEAKAKQNAQIERVLSSIE